MPNLFAAALPPCVCRICNGDPIPESLFALAHFLASENYTVHAIDGAIRDALERGTLQCSEWVDDSDRDAAEALLPTSVEWYRPEWDEERWHTGRIPDDSDLTNPETFP